MQTLLKRLQQTKEVKDFFLIVHWHSEAQIYNFQWLCGKTIRKYILLLNINMNMSEFDIQIISEDIFHSWLI